MNKRSRRQAAGAFLLLAGVVFIAAGIFRGEEGIVFTKAIRICMECIGIG